MRWLLAPFRAIVLSAHVLVGVAIVLTIFPFADQIARNRINRNWSRVLIAVCGARVVCGGVAIAAHLQSGGIDPVHMGRLALANHVSWLDIFAINAMLPSRFIAKAEIGKWPLLGLLVSRSGTLYIERGRRHAVAAINKKVREHLKLGETIVVFAEGTTTDGSVLLPFHSNVIAPALEVGASIWPIAIRYTERGRRSLAAPFVDEMSLLTSLVKILVADQLVVEVAPLSPISNSDAADRHKTARAARSAIAQHLGLSDKPAIADRSYASAD
ncbi:MAG TPA: lysophospholipid acyltransferase family protein [Burkholderiaceae bacterium]|nr:lysophospholipid acyltransferase family protein [Burkholderiaceae bacterium]